MLSEQATISTLTSTIFLLLLPFRLRKLHSRRFIIKLEHYGYVKIVRQNNMSLNLLQRMLTKGQLYAALLAGLESGLCLYTLLITPKNTLATVAAITSLIARVGLLPLLLLEHTRALRPSTQAVAYLLVSCACNAAELAEGQFPFPSLGPTPTIATLCIQFSLLVAESQSKRTLLPELYNQRPPEELAGVLSLAFAWWMNPVLVKGKHKILEPADLPSIDHAFSSRLTRRRILQAWDRRGNRYLHLGTLI